MLADLTRSRCRTALRRAHCRRGEGRGPRRSARVSVFASATTNFGTQVTSGPSHLDVFMVVLCESYHQSIGTTIYFNGYGLLRDELVDQLISYRRLLAS